MTHHDYDSDDELDDELAHELGSSLRERAEKMVGTPITFDDIRGTATSIRRRRWAGSAAAVAAVAAAAVFLVPTSLLTGGVDRTQSPEPADPPAEPFSVRLDQATPGGEEPRVAWIADQTLQTAAGPALPVSQQYDTLTRVAGTWFAGYQPGAEVVVDQLDAEGRVVQSHVTASDAFPAPVAVSADGSVGAWTTPEGEVVVWDADGRTAIAEKDNSAGEIGAVAAVVGSGPCAQNGCSVLVNSFSGDEPGLWYHSDGSTTALPDSIRFVGAQSIEGLLSVVTDVPADTGLRFCDGVYDPADEAYVWESCDGPVESFSPEGTWAMVNQSDGNEAKPAAYWVLNARTGERQGTLTAAGGNLNTAISQVVWEDDEHYLMNVRNKDGNWVVLRGDLEGNLTQALPPIPGGKGEEFYPSPYLLSYS